MSSIGSTPFAKGDRRSLIALRAIVSGLETSGQIAARHGGGVGLTYKAILTLERHGRVQRVGIIRHGEGKAGRPFIRWRPTRMSNAPSVREKIEAPT